MIRRTTPPDQLPYAAQLTTRLPYAESELRQRIMEAIGTASMCWENVARAGVFDSRRAATVGDDLIDHVIRLTGLGDPHLGCATTGELLAELTARSDLTYRTIEETP